MKRLVVWFAVMALVCAGAVSASTYVGYSGTFGIDNTKAWVSIPSWGNSPYSTGTLLRGQLHCHSYPDKDYIYDESGVGPASTMSKYRALGYDFLAVTDHNIVSPESEGWQGWAPNSVEITHGMPANDTHVITVGCREGTTMDQLDYPTTFDWRGRTEIAKDTANRVKNVHGRGGLAFVAHPDSSPYNIGVSDLVSVWKESSPDGLGIWTPWPSTAINSQNTWDRLVYALGTPVWGYVEDDYHPDLLSRGKLGKTWIAVPGSSGEWWGTIKDKIANGNYYCYYTTSGKWPSGSTPPVMHVSVSNSGACPLISVALDCSVNSIEFVGYDGGFFKKLQPAVSGSFDQYQANGREKFVRVMARYEFAGGTLWMTSQPIVVNRSGNYSPYGAMAMRAQATSPELHLRYMADNEKPMPPDAGYVGDAYDVTTDTGTVPPAATLQLSFDGEDTSALGGTQYLAIYRYDDTAQQWVKVGGAVDPAIATIESPITALGKYCISADLPADTTAPEVFIDNPVLGGVVSIDTTVKATVNDDLGAWRVKFYMNGHLLAEDADSSDGWGANLKVSDYCTGDWTLKAEAEDLAGNVGTATIPIYIASSTPPPTVTVSSPGAGNVLTGTVTATGTCGDDVAVASVALKIGDTVLGFADVSGSTWTCIIDTTYLADGNRTLTATVEDYPGNSVSATVPVVINNAAATSPLGNVKNAPEGAAVRFASAVVVADSSMVGDGFYAEAVNRTSGVKVLSGAGVHLGDSVSVVGAKTTIGHEAVVQAQDVAVISTGNTLPKPIATYATKLLLAPDSIGKIVKLWGTIGVKDTATPPTWFMLNDQSGVAIKCKLASGVTFGPAWTLIAVTGVVSTEDISGAAQIDLLVRSSDDVMAL